VFVRILVVHPGPDFSVADVHDGWVEALRELGQTVATYALNDRLTFYGNAHIPNGDGTYRKALTDDQVKQLAINGILSTCYQFWPDVIVIVSAFYVPADLFDILRTRGHRVVLICTEQPYETERELELAERADLALLNDPTQIARFPAGTRYVPHAYRPSLHYPGPGSPELACEFSFVGTGYRSRVEFLEQMDLDGIDVALAGNWPSVVEGTSLHRYLANEQGECMDNPTTAEIYRSAQVGMNLYRREAQRPELSHGWAMGPREVEMAACGLFFLRDPRGEGDELLDMLPTFTSPAEASDQLRWYLSNPAEREEAALKARSAIADRTFLRHATDLLKILDQ
jgi:spore maturation protein CgeB